MNLDNFLQETWQNHLQFLDLDANFEDKNALDISRIAILLSANEDNYERYFLLKEFQDIFKIINLRVDIFGIQYAQVCAINLLKTGFLDKEDLLKALRILEKISKNSLILEFVEKLEVKKIDKKAVFESGFKELNSINLELQKLAFNDECKQRLEKTLEKFQNLEFNICITGVMNSGKSSLLNALLKEDFLGVSNIPETANLTVLEYGTSHSAKIYFWDEREWQNILESSKFSEELRNFAEELSKDLNISEFIKKEALIKQSSLEELKSFSSAKNKLSALIKKIEIESPLEFLKNNIRIVDTPGLDDIVVQRELVTSEYLKESDFLIHLMNASQSLTQKDAQFLIHCLLNSRLSKFLIVLTKADLLGEKELNEVISYTKQSLKARLENLDSNLVEKIDFLCVSAKRASNFYKGLASKEDFEKSGMKEFEEYLFNELYSGEKTKIAMNAYKKELLLELKNLLDEYEMQNKLIKENEQSGDKENEKLFLEFKAQKELLQKAKEEIKNSILKLENLESGLDNLLLLLAKKLKERLIDELKYLQNKGQKANLSRILNITDITVKDGINDILREIKFENLKRIEDLKTALSVKYEFLQDDFESGFEEFKSQISKNIENIFSSEKFSLLRMQISQLTQKKFDFSLETELDEVIHKGFESFEMPKFLEELKINQTFFDFLNQKLAHYESSQNEKLENLENLMGNLKGKNMDLSLSYEKNLEKIARLSQLKTELLNAN
ncbi:MAG: dynamin family protein [Campylobacter sp.]|nr:dynamin family protein [Campylobacter sp.]